MLRMTACFFVILSLLAAPAAVHGAPAPAAKPAADTVLENLADGAVVIATAKLRESRVNADGDGLLKFALAVSPENRKALILQAKLDESLSLENVALADGGAKYVGLLLQAAADTKRPPRQRLLFFRAALLVQPENETALMELQKAKNRGKGDTSFEALLADAKKGWPAEETPKAPGAAPDAPAKPAAEETNGKKNSAKPGNKKPTGEEELRIPEMTMGTAPKFFRWETEKKGVKYYYKNYRPPSDSGSTGATSSRTWVYPMGYYYNDRGSCVNVALDDPDCNKLTDGKVTTKHVVSQFSVGWNGKPPPMCFLFPYEATLRTFKIFLLGCDVGYWNDAAMPASITVYDGTSKEKGAEIGSKKLTSSRRTGWVEVPLTMKTPSSCFWVEMERSSQEHVIFEEIEFKN